MTLFSMNGKMTANDPLARYGKLRARHLATAETLWLTSPKIVIWVERCSQNWTSLRTAETWLAYYVDW